METSELHLTAEHVARLAAAYGDSDKALTDRVIALESALSYGVDVKTIAADMAAAHRADDNIPAVAQSTLAYARAAITVAELIGTPVRTLVKSDRTGVADIVRAAKRVGVKRLTASVREALAPLADDDRTGRHEIVTGVVAELRAEILPAPAAQGPRNVGGSKSGESEVSEATAALNAEEATGADVINAVREVTRWLSRGGSWSPDLQSAIAELTAAASSARKRGKDAVAIIARTATETVAA
jgi:hypothetical protein